MYYPYFLHQLAHFRYISSGAEVIPISMIDEDLSVQASQLIALKIDHDPTRQFSASNPNFIYVGFSSQLPEDPALLPRYCCCIVDKPLPETYSNGPLRCNLSLVKTNTADTQTLLLLHNHLSFILADDFRYYRGVERLSHADAERSSLETIFRIICGLIVNPLILINENGEVLIGDHVADFVDPSMQKNALAGQLTRKQMNELRAWDVYAHLSEDYFKVEDSFAWGVKDYLCVPIEVQGLRVAELITQNVHSAFHYSTIRLMDYITNVLANVFARQMEERNNRSLLHSLLFQKLLEHEASKEMEVCQRIDDLHWRQVPGMQLLCCQSIDGSNPELSLPQLQAAFPGCHWTTKDQYLLLLLYPDHALEHPNLQLSSLLEPLKLRGGVSWPFNLLTHMPYAYQQALAALHHSRRMLSFYRQVFPAHIISVPTEQLRHFVHPALLELETYDQNHNSNLIQTLEAALFVPDQMSDVAERLFIHRNTLFYRLNRIRDLCGVDLSNGEERVNLLLSLRLLQGHGLISIPSITT